MAVERYRVGDVEWKASNGQRTVRARTSGVVVPMSNSHAEMLSGSARYRPLEDFVIEWARRTATEPLRRLTSWAPRLLKRCVDRAAARFTPSADELRVARGEIDQLIDANVLVSNIDFVRVVGAQTKPSSGAKISRVCFTTRNRPEELCRAITSYCHNGLAADRRFEFVIIDDSRNEGGEEVTRQLLAELQSTHGFSMRFAGMGEREAYAQRLAIRAGVEPELARFAVLGDDALALTTGSSRNCVLFDCVDEPMLLADDDGVCQIAPAAEQHAGVLFTSVGDPTEFRFFESHEDTLAAARFVNQDLLAAHEVLLGRTVSSVLKESSETPILDTLSPPTQAAMMRSGGTVRSTMAGVIGDSGIGSSAYLSIGLESAMRLTKSEDFYRAAVASRQVIRMVDRLTIGDFPFCMAGNQAIDTRSLPPVFTPVLRNSDGAFGQLLRTCHPGGYSGAIPYGVLHAPLDHRTYSLDAWKTDAQHIRYPDVLLMLLEDWRPDRNLTDSREAYAAVATQLSEVSANADQLFEKLRQISRQRTERRTARFHAAPMSQLPEFYRELRREGIDVLASASEQAGYVIPRDVRAVTNDEAAAAKATQALTQKMAQLYAAWPALWSAAGELAQEEVRLTKPVS